MIDIKDRIKQMMLENGIKTVRELAKKSGLGEEAVRKYVNGISIPNSPALHALAKAFGVSMEWVLTGELAVDAPCAVDAPSSISFIKSDHELAFNSVADSAIASKDVQKAISLIHGMDKSTREVFLTIGSLLTRLREG